MCVDEVRWRKNCIEFILNCKLSSQKIKVRQFMYFIYIDTHKYIYIFIIYVDRRCCCCEMSKREKRIGEKNSKCVQKWMISHLFLTLVQDNCENAKLILFHSKHFWLFVPFRSSNMFFLLSREWVMNCFVVGVWSHAAMDRRLIIERGMMTLCKSYLHFIASITEREETSLLYNNLNSVIYIDPNLFKLTFFVFHYTNPLTSLNDHRRPRSSRKLEMWHNDELILWKNKKLALLLKRKHIDFFHEM